MRNSAAARNWTGIDPAEAEGLEQAGELLLKIWAFNFANRQDYREEWKP